MTVISLPSLAPLIDHLEEGVLFLDQHRNVLAINQAALTMLGHEPAGGVSHYRSCCCLKHILHTRKVPTVHNGGSSHRLLGTA
jgi:sensor histidine kinase regulating citrate/malate metabolism